MARSLLLLAAFAALAPAAWLQLVDAPFDAIETGRTLGLALAPAVAVLLTRRFIVGVAVFLLAILPAAGYAFGVPVTDMRRGEQDFFGPLFDAIGSGFSEFYETRIPVPAAEFPDSAGLVLLAIFLTVALPGLVLAAGRPLAAGIALVLGLGWPVTLASTLPGVDGLRMAAVLLAAVLLVLLVSRERRGPVKRLGPAAVFSLVLIVVAAGASTSAAVAKGAFLDWQKWNSEIEPERIGVRYVWSSNYSGIKYPEEATIVLRIKAPDEKRYWRATTLDEYTGVGWRENLDPEAPELTNRLVSPLDDPLLPEAAGEEDGWLRQDVTVEALADTHLIGATVPMRVQLEEPAPLQLAEGGVVLAPRGLEYRQRYTIWSYSPKVEPRVLADLPAAYPAGLAPYFEVIPDTHFPEFGARNRDDLVRQIFRERSLDALLAEYEPLYEQALDVVEGAETPYAAVAALEAWFRSEGEFVYDEQPPPYGADPPLVTFVLDHKAGYCQQYAGGMAIMLRLLGIPARVAAGFTSGEYDDRLEEWVVTDHNAHTWVEVWFPEYGWVPFDPTPGRGQLGGSYSTSSASFGLGADFPTSLGTASPAVLRAMLARLEGGTGPQGAGEAGTPAAAALQGNGSGVGAAATTAGLVILGIAVAFGLVLGGKEARRRMRFRSSDPRLRAAACRRDLLAYLADQGVSFAPSSTLADVGDYVERSYRVNAVPFVQAATEARFGPDTNAEAAIRRARRELAQVIRHLRRQLTLSRRLRGAFNFRSLGV